jgi:hypothetical protein
MGYELNGGYNYSGTIEVDATTLGDAAERWYDRYRYGHHYQVDGCYWPCFGDMEDDGYAVINFDTDEAMTRSEILAMMGEEG